MHEHAPAMLAAKITRGSKRARFLMAVGSSLVRLKLKFAKSDFMLLEILFPGNFCGPTSRRTLNVELRFTFLASTQCFLMADRYAIYTD